jgi:predicted XRE-type DNA-binding protein
MTITSMEPATDMEDVLEIAEGSGNVWQDFGFPDAELRQMKSQTAASIIRLLDEERITVRAAAEITGITAADISRIRNADLSRFTLDRLIRVLTRLNGKVRLLVGDEAA